MYLIAALQILFCGVFHRNKNKNTNCKTWCKVENLIDILQGLYFIKKERKKERKNEIEREKSETEQHNPGIL